MDRIDGYMIDSYALRFSGTVDLDAETGEKLRFGDNFMVVAYGQVGVPVFKEDSNGDIKRVHVLKADNVQFIDDSELKAEILHYLGVNVQLRLQDDTSTDVVVAGATSTDVEVGQPELPQVTQVLADGEIDTSTIVEVPFEAGDLDEEEEDEGDWTESAQTLDGPIRKKDKVLARFLSGPAE